MYGRETEETTPGQDRPRIGAMRNRGPQASRLVARAPFSRWLVSFRRAMVHAPFRFATFVRLASGHPGSGTSSPTRPCITVQGVLHGLVGEEVPDPGCPLASLTKVAKRNGAWTIARRNDTSHLENGARATDRLV